MSTLTQPSSLVVCAIPIFQLVGGCNDKTPQALADAGSDSRSARSLNLVAVGGNITRRGPVKSDAEKKGLVTMAKTVANEGDRSESEFVNQTITNNL